MQQDNINNKKKIKKKIISFLAHRSLESRNVINLKIEILNIIIIFLIT